MLLPLDCIYEIALGDPSAYNSISRSCKHLAIMLNTYKHDHMKLFLIFGQINSVGCDHICDNHICNISYQYCKDTIIGWRLPNKNLHSKNDEGVIFNGTLTVWFYNGVLHRDDLPAMIHKTNNNYTETWYNHGKIHRDHDKPAIVSRDITMQWYRHGKLHRDNDLPAVEWHYVKYWYMNGEIHRGDDKPAAVYTNGTKEWYWHGKQHRDNDLPAYEGFGGDKHWYLHGVCHREVGPAIVNGVNESYYIQGKLHRGDDLPAVIAGTKSVWYHHGEVHREGGPAIVDGATEQYYVNGQLHREGNLPALISPLTIKYYVNGNLHRDDGGPAVITVGGKKKWYHKGRLHRDARSVNRIDFAGSETNLAGGDLPAVICPDGEEYYIYGKHHRDGDKPAIVFKTVKVWKQHGVVHRDGGPAVVYADGRVEYHTRGSVNLESYSDLCNEKEFPLRDPILDYMLDKMGGIPCESTLHKKTSGGEFWHKRGLLHNELGPARILPDGTKEWYYEGQRHRREGPAVINPDGAVEYWFHDVQIDPVTMDVVPENRTIAVSGHHRLQML